MKKVVAPVYGQIATDIALRIARGELKENTRVYGRSVLSSEYGVSPETIRKALKLLEDMKIVEVRQNSGVEISSAKNARDYVERLGESNHIRNAQKRLEELAAQQEAISREIEKTTRSIVRLNDRMTRANPFVNYEVEVPAGSSVIGQTLAELNFWHRTGATIIAIRRKDTLILSPGPYAVLQEEDTLIYVGDLASVAAVNQLLRP